MAPGSPCDKVAILFCGEIISAEFDYSFIDDFYSGRLVSQYLLNGTYRVQKSIEVQCTN